MLGRRLLCLHANIDRLSKNGRCYLWTFTLGEAEDYDLTRIRWNRLLTYLKRRLPAWAGVRVYEVHPGRYGEFSHGLHVHCICNKFHDVDLVRSVAKSAQWGRVHVLRVRKGAEYYVAKYLRKARPDALKGWRLHATFGLPVRTRLADIIVESARASLMRLAHKWHKTAAWNVKQEIVRAWDFKRVAGEWCAAVAVALAGQFRFDGRQRLHRGWVREDRQAMHTRQLAWGFHPRQGRLVAPQFDPFGSCWGPDLRGSDKIWMGAGLGSGAHPRPSASLRSRAKLSSALTRPGVVESL